MNDPQYQAGSLWAIGGALRPLSEALGSRFERKKYPKNPKKIRKKSGPTPTLGRSGGSLWVQGRNPDLIPLIAGHRAQERGRVPYILTPKENEQAPVIPLCTCCASTRRPIETGPIFRNSFMTFLTHMQFHGLKTKTPALLEFMLGSSFLIFPFLLLSIEPQRKTKVKKGPGAPENTAEKNSCAP